MNSKNLFAQSSQMRLPFSYWGFACGPDGLIVENQNMATLASRFRTPFYLFLENRLRQNARNALQIAKTTLAASQLFYSVKTNGRLRTLQILAEEGLGAEVISTYELDLALKTGFPATKIIYNGPGKTDADLRKAIRNNIHIQVESSSEARSVARIAYEERSRTRAGIRINPNIFDPRSLKTIRMGEQTTVFGLDPCDDAYKEAIELFSTSPFIDFCSISAHIGTGIIQSAPFKNLARFMMDIRDLLRSQGIKISIIDLGGGFPVASEIRLSQIEFDSLETESFEDLPKPEEIATFEEICTEVATEIAADREVSIYLEPGRLLVSDAFHLATRVIRLKLTRNNRIAILDAGRVQNALFIGRGYHEFVYVSDPLAPIESNYTLAGPLCAGFDVFARRRPMPALKEGDILLVLDVGAYNLSAQSSWSFEKAPVVALNENGEKLLDAFE